jgi:hypothetical protein
MKQLYKDSDENVEAVLTHNGDYNGKPYPGMDPINDAELIDTISSNFRQLQQVDSGHWNIPFPVENESSRYEA